MTLNSRISWTPLGTLSFHALLMLLVVSPVSAQIPVTNPLSPADDIAVGANPDESDNGWGGGSNKTEISDGHRNYTEWYHGLAFCGGTGNWCGQTCGWRQATLDFGSARSFNRVLAWHHGLEHVPNTYKIHFRPAMREPAQPPTRSPR